MARRRETRPKRARVSLLAGAFLLITGVAVLGFPSVAHWATAQVQAHAGEQYSMVANEASKERFVTAQRANASGDLQSAAEALRLDGVEAIARLTVPAIDVDLPVYPTSSDSDLRKGAGHLEGTHLPVGGRGTHSVITAHSGMPTHRMFDRLEKLGGGDTVIIDVLGETLIYEVRESAVYTPDGGASQLQPREDQDLLTLVTCTPYGVNTHRLLVTATRVADQDVGVPIEAPGESSWPYWGVLGLTGALGLVSVAGWLARKKGVPARRRAAVTEGVRK